MTSTTTSAPRHGTISSSIFALLTTMIGGGSLSLPLAFAQGGAIGGVLLLIVIATSAYGSIMKLIDSSVKSGCNSYEEVVSSAPCFASSRKFVRYVCMGSLALICWTGVVGYCVLLRDLAGIPLAEAFFGDQDDQDGPTMTQNLIMLCVVMIVTPLTMLRNLSSLQKFSMFGITSISLLGICIIYKSVECNSNADMRNESFSDFFIGHLWPHSWTDVLAALPIFVGPYMCHFNVLPVHNELTEPSRERIRSIIRFATTFSTSFYVVVGIAGSVYGNCVASGEVEGNILLNFDDKDDELMNFGKGCLTFTIALALPVMVIPCRDTILRIHGNGDSISSEADDCRTLSKNYESDHDEDSTTITSVTSAEELGGNIYLDGHTTQNLRRPLLEFEEIHVEEGDKNIYNQRNNENSTDQKTSSTVGFYEALLTLILFWGAAFLASAVQSVDIVWELTGSTLIIGIGFIAPCLTFLSHFQGDNDSKKIQLRKVWGFIIVGIFVPIMIICSSNSFYNVFWLGNQ